MQRGIRTLSVNGQAFEVRLTFNEIARAERQMDRAVWDMARDQAESGRGVNAFEIRQLFFEGVRGQHGIDTVDAAGDFIYAHPEAFADVVNVIFECAGDMYPAEVDDAGKSSGG